MIAQRGLALAAAAALPAFFLQGCGDNKPVEPVTTPVDGTTETPKGGDSAAPAPVSSGDISDLFKNKDLLGDKAERESLQEFYEKTLKKKFTFSKNAFSAFDANVDAPTISVFTHDSSTSDNFKSYGNAWDFDAEYVEAFANEWDDKKEKFKAAKSLKTPDAMVTSNFAAESIVERGATYLMSFENGSTKNRKGHSGILAIFCECNDEETILPLMGEEAADKKEVGRVGRTDQDHPLDMVIYLNQEEVENVPFKNLNNVAMAIISPKALNAVACFQASFNTFTLVSKVIAESVWRHKSTRHADDVQHAAWLAHKASAKSKMDKVNLWGYLEFDKKKYDDAVKKPDPAEMEKQAPKKYNEDIGATAPTNKREVMTDAEFRGKWNKIREAWTSAKKKFVEIKQQFYKGAWKVTAGKTEPEDTVSPDWSPDSKDSLYFQLIHMVSNVLEEAKANNQVKAKINDKLQPVFSLPAASKSDEKTQKKMQEQIFSSPIVNEMAVELVWAHESGANSFQSLVNTLVTQLDELWGYTPDSVPSTKLVKDKGMKHYELQWVQYAHNAVVETANGQFCDAANSKNFITRAKFGDNYLDKAGAKVELDKTGVPEVVMQSFFDFEADASDFWPDYSPKVWHEKLRKQEWPELKLPSQYGVRMYTIQNLYVNPFVGDADDAIKNFEELNCAFALGMMKAMYEYQSGKGDEKEVRIILGQTYKLDKNSKLNEIKDEQRDIEFNIEKEQALPKKIIMSRKGAADPEKFIAKAIEYLSQE